MRRFRPCMPAYVLFVALAGLLCCSGAEMQAAPGTEKSAPAPDRREPLPGLAPGPRALPHVGRWQVALRVPSGRIYAVAWSPDGKKIAHSERGYVRICDATTAETEHVLVGHSARVTSIDWNWTTNRIASASFDQTVRLWSASGAPGRVLSGHTREVMGVAWSKDGRRLASASKDSTIRIWTAGGDLERTLTVGAPVNCVAWSPDGKRLLSGDDRNQIRIWQMDGAAAGPPTEPTIIEGQLGPVTSLAWRPDGKRFASATFGLSEDDKRVADLRMWNLDGSPGGSDVGENAYFGIGYSPNGELLAAGCQNGVLQFHSPDGHVKDKFTIQPLDSRTSEPALAWSPDGKQLALGGNGAVAVVNVAEPTNARGLPGETHEQRRYVELSAVDPSRTRFIAFLLEGNSRERMFGNLETGFLTAVPQVAIAPSDQSFSPEGERLVIVQNQTELAIWNPEKKTTNTIGGTKLPIVDCVWNPTVDRIAYRTSDGHLAVMTLARHPLVEIAQTNVNLQPLRGRVVGVPQRLQWTRDGRAILFPDGTKLEVRRAGAIDGKHDALSIDFGMPFTQAAISADFQRAVGVRQISMEEYAVKSWSAGVAGTREVTFTKDIDGIDWSPDAKWLVLGHDSGNWELVRLDDTSVSPQETPASYGSCIATVFAPDGKRFASGGWDGLVKIWRLDGSLERTFTGPNQPVYRLWWSADAKHLLVTFRDGSIYRWSSAGGPPETVTLLTQSQSLLHLGGTPAAAKDASLAAEELIALVEKPDGSMEIVDYREFLSRAGLAAP